LLQEFIRARRAEAVRSIQFAFGWVRTPSSVDSKAESIGVQITHLYGLTETFGPSALCVPQARWEIFPRGNTRRHLKMSRQAFPHGWIEIDVSIW